MGGPLGAKRGPLGQHLGSPPPLFRPPRANLAKIKKGRFVGTQGSILGQHQNFIVSRGRLLGQQSVYVSAPVRVAERACESKRKMKSIAVTGLNLQEICCCFKSGFQCPLREGQPSSTRQTIHLLQMLTSKSACLCQLWWGWDASLYKSSDTKPFGAQPWPSAG